MVVPVFEARNLVLTYGKQLIVDDVSFCLYPGRIAALIGPNGAGKSSIMRIMAGLVKPESGSLWLKNRQLVHAEEIHRETGFFIEGPDFYKNLSASQNLMILKRVRNAGQNVEALLNQVGLSEAAGKKVGRFSRGMKQRLGVAQALLGNPSILVLDEPFNGLDPEVKQYLMEFIRKLAVENNMAILVSSHILSDLELLADDFILLRNGKVYLSGSIAEFKTEKQKIVFGFENKPDENILAQTAPGKISGAGPWGWETSLTTAETAEAVKKLVENGMVPFEIQRADLLNTKYMEII